MTFQKHFRSSRLSNFPTWNAWQGVVQQLKALAWQRKYFSFHQKNIYRQALWGLSKKIIVNFFKFSNGLSVQVWVHGQRRCRRRRLCRWIWGWPCLVFVAQLDPCWVSCCLTDYDLDDIKKHINMLIARFAVSSQSRTAPQLLLITSHTFR